MGSLRTHHLSPCTQHAAFAATHVAAPAPLSSAVVAVSFLSVVCARMAAAVPLDPRFEFIFENGAPTVANLNAAGGDPICTVAPVHFLHVASGGTLEPSPIAPGRFRVRWTEVWIALLKVCTIDPALQGTLVASRISSARAMHDLFALCSAGGLSFAAVGSPSALQWRSSSGPGAASPRRARASGSLVPQCSRPCRPLPQLQPTPCQRSASGS